MLAVGLIYQSETVTRLLAAISWPLPLWLSVFWGLAILALIPRAASLAKYLPVLVGLYGVFYFIAAGTRLIFDYDVSPPVPTSGYPLFVGAVVLPLVAAVVVLVRLNPRPTRNALILATLFVLLGSASLLLVWNIVPRPLLLLSLATDFAFSAARLPYWTRMGRVKSCYHTFSAR